MSVMLSNAEEIVSRPTAPQTIEESGLSLDLIVQLVLKTLHFAGELREPSWRDDSACSLRCSSRRSTS